MFSPNDCPLFEACNGMLGLEDSPPTFPLAAVNPNGLLVQSGLIAADKAAGAAMADAAEEVQEGFALIRRELGCAACILDKPAE